MVRKVICVVLIVSVLVTTFSYVLTTSVALSTGAALSSKAGAAAMIAMLAKIGVPLAIASVAGSQADYDSVFRGVVDRSKLSMEETPDPEYGNKWQRWVVAAVGAIAGHGWMTVEPATLYPVFEVLERDYGLDIDQAYYLSRLTPGFEINNAYIRIDGLAPEWVRDLVPGMFVSSGRPCAVRLNYSQSIVDTKYYPLAFCNEAGSFDGGFHTDGSKWYRWHNYVVYQYSDEQLADLFVGKWLVSQYASAGYIPHANYAGCRLYYNSDIDPGVIRTYVSHFLALTRLAVYWKNQGQSYYVKNVVALILPGQSIREQPMPSQVPLANDHPELPTVTNEDEVIDRAVYIWNNIESVKDIFVDGPGTIGDAIDFPLGDFSIPQALGIIRWENGAAVEWLVNGEVWGTIINDVIYYEGQPIGQVKAGYVQLNPIDPMSTWDRYYRIGNAVVLTELAGTLYMGGVPVGSRVGSTATIFGYTYPVSTVGIQVGNVELRASVTPGTVVVNTLDLQELNQALVTMAAEMGALANALNQGTSISHSILSNTQDIKTDVWNIYQTLENLEVNVDISSLEESLSVVEGDTATIIEMLEMFEMGELDLGELIAVAESIGFTADDILAEAEAQGVKLADIHVELEDLTGIVDSATTLDDIDGEPSRLKKILWLDGEAIGAAMEELRLAAADRFPFGMFYILSDGMFTFYGEGNTPNIYLPIGSGIEIDMFGNAISPQFRDGVRSFSTWIFWMMGVGFIIRSFLPKLVVS